MFFSTNVLFDVFCVDKWAIMCYIVSNLILHALRVGLPLLIAVIRAKSFQDQGGFVLGSTVREKVQSALEGVVRDLGYELYDVEYQKKQNGMNLTLFITAKAPITIDDCEVVHRAVDGILDELNPTQNAPYHLNVSSIGLDRPIKTDRDFARTLGSEVEVKLYVAVQNQKKFVGKITNFNSDFVTLVVGSTNVQISRKNIASCKLFIKF